jgi:UDP-N-acetylmuramate dehydrogenase
MFFPENVRDLTHICDILDEYCIKPLIIGNGTNLLVDDRALDMIAVKTTGLCAVERTGETVITAEAGILLSKLAVFACQLGLSGLEFAHGIPGSLGGAVTMNAGAYDGEMKDIVQKTTAYHPITGKRTVTCAEHDFSYRHSMFNNNDEILLNSVIHLEKAEKESITAKMDEFSIRRRSKQPLDLPSAGSTFKRPGDGFYAASLIEQAGLKGYTAGGAQISEKHSGFIVNRGGATFSDVLAVIDHVRETVMKQFGIELEPEIKIIHCQV